MTEKAQEYLSVNRAAVLALRAVVVAQCLGFDREETLTMGRVVAGVNGYAKDRALGLCHPHGQTLPKERKKR
jgi:hypothetical protein